MKIYFLSKNEHKLREIRSFLEPYGFEVEIMFEDKVEIQSDSLAEIVKKAVEFVGRRKYAFFAEDAGLFIDHLNGFPGPYSSYVYKTIGIDGILKLMLGVEDRKATFRSAIALFHPKLDEIKVFEGHVEGVISTEKRGTEGFGFDPIFIPRGESRTFAEMSLEEKNRYSHRARAVKKMLDFLLEFKF